MRRGLGRIFARLGISRDSHRELDRFQSSMAKIFSTNSRGSRGSRGPESSGFISDEEDLEDDVTPDFSNTELKVKLTPVNPGTLKPETDGPVEVEMVVFK